MAAGAVTQVQTLVCQNAAFAENPYCKSRSIWKGIMTAVLPPLLLTLWQNMCMPQLVYRGAQVTPLPLSERFPAAMVVSQRRGLAPAERPLSGCFPAAIVILQRRGLAPAECPLSDRFPAAIVILHSEGSTFAEHSNGCFCCAVSVQEALAFRPGSPDLWHLLPVGVHLRASWWHRRRLGAISPQPHHCQPAR